MKTTMHENSLEAYHTLDLGKRTRAILDVFIRNDPRWMTDREVKDFMGFTDSNSVRPRITELIQRGVLKERGKILDYITHKHVRTVGLNEDKDPQQTLW